MTEQNIELTRRKILGAAGAVGVAGAGAGLGTTALFSDEESFTNNSITAGTLDMTVSAEIVEASEYYTSSGDGPEIIGDMETAAGAGMIAGGVLWGYRSREELEQAGARYLFTLPHEVIELLSRAR